MGQLSLIILIKITDITVYLFDVKAFDYSDSWTSFVRLISTISLYLYGFLPAL